MMTIVYRAMQRLGVELETADVEYADYAEIAVLVKRILDFTK